MKTLIIGNGQLGRTAQAILSQNTKYEIKTTARDRSEDFQFDLTSDDLEKTLGNYKPELIILAAAYTHVDGCEQNPAKSKAVNVEGSAKIVDYCKKFDTKLMFFSTDYIFDGKNGPYSEDDQPNPLNVYGQDKLTAEKIIVKNLQNYLILRVAWLADSGFDEGNFVARLLEKLASGEELNIVDDQYGNPTLTRNLVQNMAILIDQNISGIYHLCGSETINRFAYSKKIAEFFGYDANLIGAAKSSDFPSAAIRPLHGGMNTDKIKRIPGIKLLNVREMLQTIKEGL